MKTACHFTSLFNACRFGKEDVLTFLLDKGVSLDLTDMNDRTALMIAASKGQPKIVEILLEKGVDLEAQDNEGSTALHFAA